MDTGRSTGDMFGNDHGIIEVRNLDDGNITGLATTISLPNLVAEELLQLTHFKR
jgi:hypothetical protein